MSQLKNWGFPANLQPQSDEVRYDLDAAIESVVQLRAEVPDEAFTAGNLGTDRTGNGVVIGGDGLVLTIGYLITEATAIWLTTHSGKVVAGHPLAYDQNTGLGLVMPLGRLDTPMLPRGPAASVSEGDEVVVIGAGGRVHSLKAEVVSRREFAGYWEYVLDEAFFTAPAHPQWGGAAMVAPDGALVGLGSLLVQEARGDGETLQGNMFVPVELLDPILDAMLSTGRAPGPPRPWIGIYVAEVDGHLAVSGVADGGPSDSAGVRAGDIVLEVGGARPTSLADLFRRFWTQGPAGVEIVLRLGRRGATREARIRSVDRNDLLLKPRMH